MNDLLPIVGSVLGVFLVMALGGVCRRRGWIAQQADHSLAKLIANVLLPAYFVSRIFAGPQFESLALAWQPPMFGFMMTSGGFAIGYLFAKKIGPRIGLVNDSQQRAFALCVGICNYGYIPLPLAERFYPDAVIPLILHNVGVDLALWSVGLAIISGGTQDGWKRVFLSPPFIAVFVASFMKVVVDVNQIPLELMFVVNALGDCAIPIGLLLSGAIMMDFLSDVSWMRSPAIHVSAIVIRQLILPSLMIAAALLLSVGKSMQEVVLLQAAMPAAVFPIVLVRLYERDAETSMQVILSTSLAGFILIPVWLFAGGLIFGF